MDAKARVLAAVLQLDRAECVLGWSLYHGLVTVEFIGGDVVEGYLDVTGKVNWDE